MLAELIDGQCDWLDGHFPELTTRMVVMTPSQWAESQRYLPPQVTPMPGFYRFDVAPYLREIVDCMGVESPVREVSVMKGAQVCFTTGVIENVIGYFIAHVKTAPMMLVTADAAMAKTRIETSIIPMIQESGLSHLIKSSDENNGRKTGKTDKKIEWLGGGFLVPFGAQSGNKLRSLPILALLRDEIDGWPLSVGRDGDPMKLSGARTNAYESSRKIVNGSTPTIEGLSKIHDCFKRGDQRYYFVRCLGCGFPQILRWNRTDNLTGAVSGIVWETQNGLLVPGSVRYICENPGCGHAHTNDDKTRLLSPDYGAEWKATATSENPAHQSYHIGAAYSPVGMRTWEEMVRSYLESWDPVTRKPRDIEKLQEFYNNDLGVPFKAQGERVRFEVVSAHRRIGVYNFGEIPNKWAIEHAGGPVLLLVCTVDVHGDNLAVSVFGWCRGSRPFLIDYDRYKGDTEQLDDAGTWGRLRALIDTKEYKADDGKRYRVAVTLVDSGYLTDQAYRFAAEYDGGVFPVKGRETPPKGANLKEFSEFETTLGTIAYGITVDIYKDRWSARLRHGWDGQGLQPEGHFNAPADVTDAQLKELTVEVKREKRDKITNQRLGTEWHRPSGAANELWDCLVYSNAAIEMLAHHVCVREWGLEFVIWDDFWNACEQQKRYFSEPPN